MIRFRGHSRRAATVEIRCDPKDRAELLAVLSDRVVQKTLAELDRQADGHDDDEAVLTRLRKHMRQLKWCLGLTATGWFMAALTGADPRCTPPFAILIVTCVLVMLVTRSRVRSRASS